MDARDKRLSLLLICDRLADDGRVEEEDLHI